MQQEVYPAVYKFLSDINPNSEGCLKAISELTNEIATLEKVETKLIFPSVLSLLQKENDDDIFSPNIEQVIKLTQQKQDKIKQLFCKLFTEVQICNGCNKIEIGYEFNNVELSFFDAKQKWLAMLHFLTSNEYKCKNRVAGNCTCKTSKKTHHH